MSIFDPPNDKGLSEDYPPGTPLMLYSGDYEGTRETQFGPSASATVRVGPADRTGEPVRYKVWGTLAEQVAQIEPGDLPRLVTIGKTGNRKVWQSVTQSGEPIPF